MAQPSLIAQCDRILISLGKVIGLIPVKLIDKMSLDHAGAKEHNWQYCTEGNQGWSPEAINTWLRASEKNYLVAQPCTLVYCTCILSR